MALIHLKVGEKKVQCGPNQKSVKFKRIITKQKKKTIRKQCKDVLENLLFVIAEIDWADEMMKKGRFTQFICKWNFNLILTGEKNKTDTTFG